jgi:hypothetical protein
VRQRPRIIEPASSWRQPYDRQVRRIATTERRGGRVAHWPRFRTCSTPGLGSDKEHIGGRASVMNSVSARFIGVRLTCGLADRRLITFSGSTMTATCIKRPYRQNPTDLERAPTSIGARRNLPLSCASRPRRNSGEPCSQERTRKWPN